PVCFTAMTFSTWAALNVIKLPSPVVGLGLGCVFVLLSLLFLTLSRLRKSANPRISLGLCMITIGCYFLATLILPAKIEEAKEIYKSFIVAESSRLVENTKRDASSTIDLNNNIGVLALLFSSILIGFFGKQRADT
ncbi:transporter, partial [Candidatus Desantisbacteria bacterium]|nr:transporter [Candidatus Desantisbacteria bacterium]